jgi:hypothetical protein
MTQDKNFKRLVRARQAKTGESYAAARAMLVAQGRDRRAPATAESVPSAAARARHTGFADVNPAVGQVLPTPEARGPSLPGEPEDYARRAGMSDAALEAKTGCAWETWIKSLDHAGAVAWPHAAIARYLRERYSVSSWWAQTIAVGYERVRGLRERGQKRSGQYAATKSRTFDVGVSTLYRAVRQPKARARWLVGATATMRSATPSQVVRFTWEDGSSVEVTFTSKGARKSALAVEHSRLPDKATAERLKAWWTARLDALGAELGITDAPVPGSASRERSRATPPRVPGARDRR